MEDYEWAALKADMEEAFRAQARLYARQDVDATEILFKPRTGGRQNGKSQPRGQHPSHIWFDEIRDWRPTVCQSWSMAGQRHRDLSAVEAVAAKYATEPNYQVAGIVHRAEHYGVDCFGNR